jgi:hypothetical protein
MCQGLQEEISREHRREVVYDASLMKRSVKLVEKKVHG